MTLTQEETERYARHLSLPELGEQGQYKLKRAHVALTGLGGLGSPAALYLAAAGVGRLTLIDPDEVCLSNLQRQILHATDAAGTAKTASAARRLYALNPSVRINTVHRRLTPENAVSLLEGCDLVLDASDNYAARFAMADAACTLRIPLVYGAVKGFIGQVAVFAPHQGTACYRCLFPADTPMQEKDRLRRRHSGCACGHHRLHPGHGSPEISCGHSLSAGGRHALCGHAAHALLHHSPDA